MEKIVANISDAIGLLVWSDWLTMLALLVFVGLGIKRGLIVEAINLSFLTAAILGAGLFHEGLSRLSIIQWVLSTYQSQLIAAFGLIFIAVLVLRRVFYQLTTASSAISGPCAFNKFFALLILLILNVFASWYYVSSIADLDPITYFIANDALRIELSFVLLFAMITGVILLLKKAFGVSFKTNESCFFRPLFQIVLTTLQNINTALNASNTGPIRKTGGAVIGLIKGCVLIVMVILLLQSIDFVAEQNFWLESQNLFKAFQELTASVKSELAEHLLFINKD